MATYVLLLSMCRRVDELGDYVMQSDDPVLLKWWAAYLESIERYGVRAVPWVLLRGLCSLLLRWLLFVQICFSVSWFIVVVVPAVVIRKATIST
jgi:hypothetical protein